MRLAAVRHIGAYHEIGSSFGKITGYARKHGIHSDVYIGLYHDAPDVTQMQELRSDAAVELPEALPMPEACDLPAAGEVHGLTLPAGDNAVATYVGP